eukprot:31205-Pelagococcus_subviridis.AAC.20
MRRAKSLRIGVHHGDGVVWEPVHGTHLRRVEERQDVGARRVVVLLRERRARQQPGRARLVARLEVLPLLVQQVPGDFEHRGVDARGDDVRGERALRRALRKLVRNQKHPRAVIRDEKVKRDVARLQPLAAHRERCGERLEPVAPAARVRALEAQASRGVVHDVLDDDARA